MTKSFTSRILLIGTIVSFVSLLRGQGTSTASISGKLTDGSGAALVGANVQATNRDTQVRSTTVTDSGGRFALVDLSIGFYDLRASHPGFEAIVHSGVLVTVGADLVVDFKLQIGQAHESIVVTSEVSRVETQSAAVSSLVTSHQISSLPLNGRNFEQLIALAPGVSVSPSTLLQVGAGPVNPIYGNQDNYSVSGARAVGAAFLLDSTDISDFFNHGTGSGIAGTSLGVDAIAEFQLLTNTYSARFGGTGAVVNMATKSGTNQLHGTAYEFLRNNRLDSRGYFDVDANGKPAPAPPYRRNQFGGSLGGPVRKDKVFFYANFEGLFSSLGQTHIAYVPEPYVLNGQVCSVNPQNQTPGATTCPVANLTQLVGTVPQTQAAILALYPKPSAAAPDLGGYAPVPESASLITKEKYFLARVDYSISPKDTLFARYTMDRANQTNPFAGSLIPLWRDLEITRNQYATAEERHTFGTSAVNQVRLSFVRTHSAGTTTSSQPALHLFPSPGRPDTVVSPGGGVSPVGANSAEPFVLLQNKSLIGDDLIWIKGKHRFEAGASVARIQSIFAQGAYAGGDFTFYTLSSFLLGSANLYYGSTPPTPAYNGSRGFRQIDFFPYFQDNWKVLPRLTLNLGLRWDFTTNPVGSGAPLEAVVNPVTDAGYSAVPRVFAQNPNWANLDPRAGLAYDPFDDHKTSIRAAFGIFHEQVEARTYAPGYMSAAPSGFILYQPPIGGLPFPEIPAAPIYETQGISYRGVHHAPYVIQYNFTVQREIFARAIASLGYVGSHGVRLFNQVNQNLPIPCSSAAGPLPGWCPAKSTGDPGSVGNPFSGQFTNPNLAVLGEAVPSSTSRYHSLQASLNQQFGAAIQTQASYTWSTCIDDGSSTYPLENSFGQTNPYNRGQDRGACAFNRRQNLAANAVYTLPFRGNRLASGWRIAALMTAATGLPVNVADGYSQSLGGGESRPNYSGAAGCQPNHIVNRPVAGPAIQYFNPACYVLEPIGTNGNVERNSIDGPGLLGVDISVVKSTKINERLNSEFRAEVFNSLNRANFGLPNPAIFTGPTGGQITTLATPPRQIQFAVRLLF